MLYNEEKEKEKTEIKDELNHGLFKEELKCTKYRLFIGGFNSIDHELDEIINELSKATPQDELEIIISSPGGFTTDLMKMENTIRTYFYGRSKTILNSYGYSCGAMLFLCGDERIIYENSELMFHNISTGTFGKLSDVKTEIKHNEKYFERYMKYSLKPYFSNSEMNDLLNGQEFWLDALEICERGIATGINVFGAIMDPKLYVEYRKNKKTKAELVKALKKNPNVLSLRDRDFLTSIK